MKKIVLTFDDACKSHLDVAVPLLKKYGFNATFFISLPQSWIDDCPDGFLSHEEIAKLYKQGFELGNHTMNHPALSSLSAERIRFELGSMNKFLADIGAEDIVSFAYPGGPYSFETAEILPEFGLKYARTTEHGVWTCKTDPMRIPCFAICDRDKEYFKKAVELAETVENGAVVLLYHGVPDIAHLHCSTERELFEQHMKYFYDNGYEVVSMAQYGKNLKQF